jgi:hypothetical protein
MFVPFLNVGAESSLGVIATTKEDLDIFILMPSFKLMQSEVNVIPWNCL